MDSEQNEAVAGQVDALSMVVTQLAMVLSPEQAQRAAAGLAAARKEPASATNFSTPEQQTIARDGVLDGYQKLLDSVSRSR